MGQRRAYQACGSGGSRSQAGALPGGWLISWPGLAILANSARSQPDGQTSWSGRPWPSQASVASEYRNSSSGALLTRCYERTLGSRIFMRRAAC